MIVIVYLVRYISCSLHIYICMQSEHDEPAGCRYRQDSLAGENCFEKIFFASGVGFPLYPEMFYIHYHNDPAAHQDHCGRCRIQTWDLCPRSLVHY